MRMKHAYIIKRSDFTKALIDNIITTLSDRARFSDLLDKNKDVGRINIKADNLVTFERIFEIVKSLSAKTDRGAISESEVVLAVVYFDTHTYSFIDIHSDSPYSMIDFTVNHVSSNSDKVEKNNKKEREVLGNILQELLSSSEDAIYIPNMSIRKLMGYLTKQEIYHTLECESHALTVSPDKLKSDATTTTIGRKRVQVKENTILHTRAYQLIPNQTEQTNILQLPANILAIAEKHYDITEVQAIVSGNKPVTGLLLSNKYPNVLYEVKTTDLKLVITDTHYKADQFSVDIVDNDVENNIRIISPSNPLQVDKINMTLKSTQYKSLEFIMDAFMFKSDRVKEGEVYKRTFILDRQFYIKFINHLVNTSGQGLLVGTHRDIKSVVDRTFDCLNSYTPDINILRRFNLKQHAVVDVQFILNQESYPTIKCKINENDYPADVIGFVSNYYNENSGRDYTNDWVKSVVGTITGKVGK